MGDVIRRETPAEYFKELVESALEHQRVAASQSAAYYVVDLLSRFGTSMPGDDAGRLVGQPLGVRLVRGLQRAGAERRAALRQVGDISLFLTGFFADSLNARVVDVDYYVSLGGYAYRSLSRDHAGALGSLFEELATKFVPFMDIIAEVAERSAIANADLDLLRLYERWLRTGSKRSSERLVQRGIAPIASPGSRSVQ